MAVISLERRLPECPLEDHPVLAALVAHERALWTLMLAAAAFDVGITVVGLRIGFTEANPVAATVLAAWGLPGAVGLKALAVGVGVAEWMAFPQPYRSVIAPSMTLPWLAGGGYNTLVLATAVL
jgi:uncharacterized membrane protein AbrB (regulator of aidB expression)